jgi:DNA-binding response OmpR family regulator
LKANGYDVAAAGDGVQAMTAVNTENPDLVILDIRMPAGGGLSVYENLKKSFKTSMIPILFMTAYSEDPLWMNILDMEGTDNYLTKPFGAKALLEKVKNIFEEK